MRMGKRDFSDDMRFGKRGEQFTIQGHRKFLGGGGISLVFIWPVFDWKIKISKAKLFYSVSHNFIAPLLFAGNQGDDQNFEKSLVHHKSWLIWIRKEQKKIFFLKKKIQNGRLKKNQFFNHPQKLSNFRQNFTDWSLG